MAGGTEDFGCLIFDFGWGEEDEDWDEDEVEYREFSRDPPSLLTRCAEQLIVGDRN